MADKAHVPAQRIRALRNEKMVFLRILQGYVAAGFASDACGSQAHGFLLRQGIVVTPFLQGLRPAVIHFPHVRHIACLVQRSLIESLRPFILGAAGHGPDVIHVRLDGIRQACRKLFLIVQGQFRPVFPPDRRNQPGSCFLFCQVVRSRKLHTVFVCPADGYHHVLEPVLFRNGPFSIVSTKRHTAHGHDGLLFVVPLSVANGLHDDVVLVEVNAVLIALPDKSSQLIRGKIRLNSPVPVVFLRHRYSYLFHNFLR